MRITYDPDVDALWIELRQPEPGGYGEDLEEGVILHRDAAGHVVALEVLDASERVGPKPLAHITLEHFPSTIKKPGKVKRPT